VRETIGRVRRVSERRTHPARRLGFLLPIRRCGMSRPRRGLLHHGAPNTRRQEGDRVSRRRRLDAKQLREI
jgi:hypothetical protein